MWYPRMGTHESESFRFRSLAGTSICDANRASMRIAIVNDLPLAAEAIRRVIVAAPVHQVAWMARDGAEAVRRCAEDRPDLILMDLIMPVMDGVAATSRIMAATPCAIL